MTGHQPTEQGVGPIRATEELGMGLGTHPKRMVGQFDELDETVIG